jgi:hypothetical protein
MATNNLSSNNGNGISNSNSRTGMFGSAFKSMKNKFSSNLDRSGINIDLSSALFAFSPIIVPASILLFSAYSMSMSKGLLYLFFLIVFSGLRVLLYWLLQDEKSVNPDLPSICTAGSFLPYDKATYSIYILTFSMAYLLMPMLMADNVNYLIILFFTIYIAYVLLFNTLKSCYTSLVDTIVNLVGGYGLGSLIAFLIYISPMKNFLFVNELASTREVCSQPKQQTFRCSLFRNGELVSSSLTK